MTRNTFVVIGIAVVALTALLFAFNVVAPTHTDVPMPEVQEENASTTPQLPAVTPYGATEVKLGEWAVFPDVRIKTIAIEEDSRCPVDVQCIQAGTVKVRVQTVSGMGTSTDVLSLGDSLTTEAEVVTFVSVRPEAISTRQIDQGAYQFTFEVQKRAVEIAPPAPSFSQPPVSAGKCYVGGCSSQLCSDRPDMASTCEYREEYACYQSARCERQTSGQCGWTPTAAFNACMVRTQQTVYPQ